MARLRRTHARSQRAEGKLELAQLRQTTVPSSTSFPKHRRPLTSAIAYGSRLANTNAWNTRWQVVAMQKIGIEQVTGAIGP